MIEVWYLIETNRAGEIHEGRWRAENGAVTVSTTFGAKTARTGGAPPGPVAEAVLDELVRGGLQRRHESLVRGAA
jgi:hypothetical protein